MHRIGLKNPTCPKSIFSLHRWWARASCLPQWWKNYFLCQHARSIDVNCVALNGLKSNLSSASAGAGAWGAAACQSTSEIIWSAAANNWKKIFVMHRIDVIVFRPVHGNKFAASGAGGSSTCQIYIYIYITAKSPEFLKHPTNQNLDVILHC